MTRKKLALILLVAGFIIIVLLGLWYARFRPKSAALLIETQPTAQVFIDGEKVGTTPYEGQMQAREVTLKLIPESFETPRVPFEAKINLSPGVKTIVRRELGETGGESSGIIVSFVRTGTKEANIAVVTKPDAAQVYLDNVLQDSAPVKISGISAGSHDLVVRASGYNESNLAVQAINGYDLTAVIDLAPDQHVVAEENNESSEVNDFQKVLILETPTGYLRVRESASSSADEVGQVSPDEYYTLLEISEDEQWYKIQFDDKEGWISTEYASPADENKD